MKSKTQTRQCRASKGEAPVRVANSGRDEMIVNSIPLVKNLARHLARRLPPCVEVDELISAGHLGLIKAADGFEGDRGLQFGTYARHRVLGEMLDFLRAQDPLARAECRARKALPAGSEFAGSGIMSLSNEIVFEEASQIRSGEEIHSDCITRTRIVSARRSLSAKEDRVIELSFYSGWRNREIAEKMGVNESRISQLRSGALSKLRTQMVSESMSAAA